MAITVLTPDNWEMAPPGERGSHQYMMINPESPHVRLLEAEPHSYTGPHSHNVPEVFVVLKGRLLFNGQWCGPGTVVYVPASEDYWHTTGAEQCIVALMRPGDRGMNRHAAVGTSPE